MSTIDPIRAIDTQFLRAKLLDKLADLTRPCNRHVFICPNNTVEFVAGFVANYGGVLSVCLAGVGIDVGQELLNVVFKDGDYLWVGVEFQSFGWEWSVAAGNVVA